MNDILEQIVFYLEKYLMYIALTIMAILLLINNYVWCA